MLTKLKHWWQRSFGYVYVTDRNWITYRFRCRFGRIALVWGDAPFVCELSEDGTIIITDKACAGYGKPYPHWTWDYTPPLAIVRRGGYWK